MASENDTHRVGVGAQLFNFVKLAGDIALIPGTSLLMQGKVPQGGTHAILGFLAKTALRSLPIVGTASWLLLAANSYAKSSSGTYLHDYVLDFFGTRSEPEDAPGATTVAAAPPAAVTATAAPPASEEPSGKAKPAGRSA